MIWNTGRGRNSQMSEADREVWAEAQTETTMIQANRWNTVIDDRRPDLSLDLLWSQQASFQGLA